MGVVTQVHPSAWRTPDGSPPIDVNEAPALVYTPLLVSVNDVLRGDPLAIEVPIVVPGGRIGCSEYFVSTLPAAFRPGERYVFFMEEVAPYPNGATLIAYDAWRVSNGIVHTPLEGDLPLQQFLSLAAAVPVATPNP